MLADRLGVEHVVVVHNCPPRPTSRSTPQGRLQGGHRIGPGVPLIIYHGGFSPERGLEELAEACPPARARGRTGRLPRRILGDRLDSIAAEERFGKRLHVVDAVPPEELLGWVADADVSIMAIRPTTLNHRLATPNKLFESLTAGVPVVASDLPAMAPIVRDDPAGPLGAL